MGIGVGTVKKTGALAPAVLKPLGESIFCPAIICQVYLLVDSQSSISLYSFKILNFKFIIYSQMGIFYENYVRHVNALNYTPTLCSVYRAQFCIACCNCTAHLNPKCTKILGGQGFAPAPDPMGKLAVLLQTPVAGGGWAVNPFQRTRRPFLSPSGFEFRPFGPRLAPALPAVLISFRRHCQREFFDSHCIPGTHWGLGGLRSPDRLYAN